LKTIVIAFAFAASITPFCASAHETRAADIERARLDGKAFLDLSASHRDYAGLAYYGPGPDSVKTGRRDDLFEGTSMALPLVMWLSLLTSSLRRFISRNGRSAA
jgi:hypothetical protein